MPAALSPATVAALRGVLEAVILAALAALGLELAELSPTQLAGLGPVAFLLVRWAEGLVDRHVDPTRQRAPLGGRPVLEPGAPVPNSSPATLEAGETVRPRSTFDEGA